MGKESFLIYKSFYKPIARLSDKQLGRLFRAIFKYQLGEEVTVEEDIEMAFGFFINQFEIDETKYHSIVERNRNNGRKGGAPIGNCNAKLKQPKQPSGLNSTQTTQNKPNDNDNDNDNDNVYVSDKSDINKTSTNVDSKENHDSEKTPYDKFCGWVKTNAPNVLKLQRQITETQFLKLKEKYDYKQIISILQSMDNHKELTKKYTSVYLTFLNWAKKAYGD